MRLTITILLLCLFLFGLGGNHAWAAEQATLAETEFSRGVTAFNAEQYQQALKHFQASAEAGTDSAQLHYNLGVTFYKLKRYQEAEAEFQQSAKKAQWKALSYYNLALIAYRTQRLQRAQDYAQRAWSYSSDEKVRTLSQALMQRIDPSSVHRVWQSGLSLAAGYDNNVLLESDSSAIDISNKRDSYVEAYWQTENENLLNSDTDLKFGLSLYVLDYSEVNDYDYADIAVSLKQGVKLASWKTQLGVMLSQSYLSGSSLQTVSSGEMSGSRRLYRHRHHKLEARYRADQFTMHDNEYDYLAGWRHEVRLRIKWVLKQNGLSASYRYEYNDRDDLKQGGDFFSYSPIRHAVGVKAELSLGGTWFLLPAIAYRDSRYREPERRAGLSKTREDQEYETVLELKRKYGAWWLGANYRYNNNDSNFDEYDYDRTQLSLDMARRF